ncbi:MAG TPA: DNA gyrase inhibitor YacG [Verrucomicrobiae bacterium]|nr:DNA gyrase inhibitor YacG [Verrucomicrobiae bacterium]
MCRQPAQQRYRPFCSQRCADVDLGRWIGGDYRVPGNPVNALDSGEEEEGDEG